MSSVTVTRVHTLTAFETKVTPRIRLRSIVSSDANSLSIHYKYAHLPVIESHITLI